MKKFVLLTTVAFIAATPAMADSVTKANKAESSTPGHSYQLIERDLGNGNTMEVKTTTYRAMAYKGDNPKSTLDKDVDLSGRYALDDGRHMEVKGRSAYLADAEYEGKFFAPKGAYVTEKGLTIFVEDGQVLRVETPPQVVYVDTDKIIN